MKFLKSAIIGLAGVAGIMMATSCDDYLDVNDDPNNAGSQDAQYFNRLVWIEHYTNYAYNIAGHASNMICGDWVNNLRTNNQGKYAQWHIVDWRSTQVYQFWFVGAAKNVEDMIERATENRAWHYVGAGHLIRAYGYMLMTDIYGEMPYKEATTPGIISPKYDTGRTIFTGCLEDIDKAIEYLSIDQDPKAMPLSMNDAWGNGNPQTWIKAAYLLKARWLNHLIKKGEGNAADMKWDAQEILRCLEKAHAGNSDNMLVNHTDQAGGTTDILWNEQTYYHPLFSCVGMNANYFVTKTVEDNFTNFGGYGIEDPRADKIMPWARSQKSSDTPADIKWSADGRWRRSKGVDMQSDIRINNGPSAILWKNGKFTADIATRAGDTIYVEQLSGAKGHRKSPSLIALKENYTTGTERSSLSGSFYTRPSSQSYIACYHEACFIKAEVLFKLGRTNEAFQAYKDGIRAHIDLMNSKLSTWCGEDPSLKNCPSFTPMDETAINNYIENGIGTPGDLTLGKIMTQKRMAMMFSVEQYNDMRRYDYDPSIFLNWDRPYEYDFNADAKMSVPEGKHPRRWVQCTHEVRYNQANLNAIAPQVPGANLSIANWQSDPAIATVPVWWDSDQE